MSPDLLKDEIGRTVRRAAQQAGLRVVRPRERLETLADETPIPEDIARADCIIAEISDLSPDVYFCLGLAKALGKPAFLLQQFRPERASTIDISDNSLIEYSSNPSGLRQLSVSLIALLKDFKDLPRRPRFLLASRARSLFVVDWDRINQEDFENICLELLTQLGYRRIDWGKNLPDIDLVAELPKKDPDGYQYRELWLVSLGRNTSPEMLIDMARHDPDYFLHRVLRYFDGYTSRRDQNAASMTLLVITKNDWPRREIEYSRSERNAFGGAVRLRVWSQHYLTNLVYQFPTIGFKYFSDEARAESKYRKTPEQLFEENMDLTRVLSSAISELEDERGRRVRAEGDAIWKDISFNAAHRMGNPIFAIETDLDPLIRRIEEQRVPEALQVIAEMRISVEKAKGIVNQFKSLATAQQLSPSPTLLRPILEDACNILRRGDIACEISCPDGLMILADQERIAECFDELACNALHWFDKDQKRVTISVTIPEKGTSPEPLDGTKTYALILFRDNGCGIPIENKKKIFDAFFTTYHHGTGLGLALVRHVIEGHGGSIVEFGTPGEGAGFEIYLPIAEPPSLELDSLPNTTDKGA